MLQLRHQIRSRSGQSAERLHEFISGGMQVRSVQAETFAQLGLEEEHPPGLGYFCVEVTQSAQQELIDLRYGMI